MTDRSGKVDTKDEILYTASRPSSAVRLDTVVGLIDHVKDEMNFFKEKVSYIMYNKIFLNGLRDFFI